MLRFSLALALLIFSPHTWQHLCSSPKLPVHPSRNATLFFCHKFETKVSIKPGQSSLLLAYLTAQMDMELIVFQQLLRCGLRFVTKPELITYQHWHSVRVFCFPCCLLGKWANVERECSWDSWPQLTIGTFHTYTTEQ